METQYRNITKNETTILNTAASLVSKYSWGSEYPLNPIDEIKNAEYCIGAFNENRLVGFASVGYGFSPDKKDDEKLWLAHAVVEPAFRKQGVFKKLYEMQINYSTSKKDAILTCTDNPIVEIFLQNHGWKKVRDTQDESGSRTTVFSLCQQKSSNIVP